MDIILNDGTRKAASQLKFKEWRELMAEFLASSSASAKAWDLMSALRGPDSPSETDDMGYDERTAAYAGRRARKYATTEAIREEAFFGTVGGSARHHKATFVTVPPAHEQDHFDRHIVRAALVLGLEVKYKKEEAE